ncbi:MAG: serine/threonine-protein kinase [Gemmatimonadota bacterium]|nr:serine/threonine-protein kinase [Gemmatimonadota bacterium]
MAERIERVQRGFTAYTVERELGRGGMATVYLAHDKKHDRKVAIKILHAELAAVLGAERFLQEIRVTANLQHPHILGLIDSGLIGEDAGDLKERPYYVMPYIEGQSLRQRLEKEQQLPVSDSVRIATEVASALDYAHRHGLIHRDIKPENILLHDGSAIVADFGIALAVTEAGGARITQTGLSLGTPSYMSPEQAMGERTITARSDIYSLGAVTYEMLSGEPPFTAPTVQAVVARVLTEEPRPLTTLRRAVPHNVDAAVARALERLPADRFSSAHEFAEALNNPSFTQSSKSSTITAQVSNKRLKRMFYGAAALAALFLATTLWSWLGPAPAQPVLRYILVLDSAESMVPGTPWSTRFAISPDGSRLAYVSGPRAQLLIRRRNQLHATAVPQSEGAQTPFFSPDGNQVGFLRERQIQIASVNGGPPITVANSLTGVAGASWGRDGFIYVDGEQSVSLLSVEAKTGSVPKWFTVLDSARGEIDHTWPDVLPNGKGVIFTDAFNSKDPQTGRTRYSIAIAEVPSGKHRVLVENAMYARYAESGHLVYVTTNRTLMIAPFDQNSMKITGEATPLIEGVRMGQLGAADVAVSSTGTLVYVTGAGEGEQEVVWVARDGKAESVDPDWQGSFWTPTISPDGKHVAIMSGDPSGTHVFTKQLDRGPSVKLTFEGREAWNPTWSPDGRAVLYGSAGPAGTYDLKTKRADGSGSAALVRHGKRGMYGARWSPDGKWLIFVAENGGDASLDIFGVRPAADTTAVPLVATTFSEMSPAQSPDGKWLAYTSDESGQTEVYVVPFPQTDAAKWIVSSRGGTEPLWSHSGRELFYRDRDGNMVAVEVKTTPTFAAFGLKVLFSGDGFLSSEFEPQYAVSADDRRFLMIRSLAPTTPDKLIVVDNWFKELKATSRK